MTRLPDWFLLGIFQIEREPAKLLVLDPTFWDFPSNEVCTTKVTSFFFFSRFATRGGDGKENFFSKKGPSIDVINDRQGIAEINPHDTNVTYSWEGSNNNF